MSTYTLTGGNFDDNDEEYMTLDQLLDKLEEERKQRTSMSWWEED